MRQVNARRGFAEAGTAEAIGAQRALWSPVLRAATVIAVAAAVWRMFLRAVQPADLMVFVRAGQSVVRGVTPYADPSSVALWSGHAFVYPYLVAWVFVPLGLLPHGVAETLYFAASVLAVLIAIRLSAGPRVPLVNALLVLTAEPVVRGLQLGTINVFLLLGLTLAWRYRQRSVVVITVLTGVVVAKLFLLPMLAWLAFTRRWRALAPTAALSALGVLIGCVFAHQAPTTLYRMLSVLSAHEASQSSSLVALARYAGANSTLASSAAVIIAVLILGAGLLCASRAGDEAYLFCACVLASLAACPIVWSHYLTLLAVAPLILGWTTRSLAVAWAVTWAVATPVGQPWLQVLHPFPGSGWMWAGVIIAAHLGARHVGGGWTLMSCVGSRSGLARGSGLRGFWASSR